MREAASTLMDLEGLGDQAFSVNISNDTDILRQPTSYLIISDVPKVFSILSQNLPHLSSCPMLWFYSPRHRDGA